jgi:hypothetical protein
MAFAERVYLWKLGDRGSSGNDDVAEWLYGGTGRTVEGLNGSRRGYPSMSSCPSRPSRRWITLR